MHPSTAVVSANWMSWLAKAGIVVPLDFSEQSLAALDVALSLARCPARLHVIHVLPNLTAQEPGAIWEAVDDARRCQHAEGLLCKKLDDPKFNGVDIVVSVGDPGQQIADFAESVVADLVVLTSHGRTGLARLLIGSVAERVVRLAHCPVLVLKS